MGIKLKIMNIINSILQILFLLLLNCVLVVQSSFAYQSVKIDDIKFTQILQKIQTKLNDLHTSLNFPGATVGFVLPEGRSGSASTGFADSESKLKLQPTDHLLAGSIGKTFVATETLLLVQEGKLDLDEKIERWLGNEKWFAQLPNAKEITLRMLLNHSSGIPNHVDDKNFQKAMFKSSAGNIKYEQLFAYVLNKKPLFAAGKGYNYADTNYILVGMIVEAATGKTLYDEITQRILKPLKLDGTIPSNDLVLPQTATGYFQNKPVIMNGKFIVNPQWEWAGGGFASTAEDLARWAWLLYAGDVLQKKYLDEMLGSTTVGEGKDYGLGVEIAHGKFGKAFGHDGEFPGYLSDMRYFSQYNIAVAVQVNADENPAANKFIGSAVNDFAQIIIGELFDEKLSVAEKLQFQQTVESWLKLVDEEKFIESWENISAELKAKYARDQWQTALQPFLKKIGKFKSRKLKSVIYSEAEKVAVDFESSFTKLVAATETIILKLEKDGRWHIASYSIN
jgi:D-alanyl-D-alanine carboxypeptidase